MTYRERRYPRTVEQQNRVAKLLSVYRGYFSGDIQPVVDCAGRLATCDERFVLLVRRKLGESCVASSRQYFPNLLRHYKSKEARPEIELLIKPRMLRTVAEGEESRMAAFPLLEQLRRGLEKTLCDLLLPQARLYR